MRFAPLRRTSPFLFLTNHPLNYVFIPAVPITGADGPSTFLMRTLEGSGPDRARRKNADADNTCRRVNEDRRSYRTMLTDYVATFLPLTGTRWSTWLDFSQRLKSSCCSRLAAKSNFYGTVYKTPSSFPHPRLWRPASRDRS